MLGFSWMFVMFANVFTDVDAICWRFRGGLLYWLAFYGALWRLLAFSRMFASVFPEVSGVFQRFHGVCRVCRSFHGDFRGLLELSRRFVMFAGVFIEVCAVS